MTPTCFFFFCWTFLPLERPLFHRCSRCSDPPSVKQHKAHLYSDRHSSDIPLLLWTVTFLGVNCYPESLQSFPLNTASIFKKVLGFFLISILRSSSVFWENFLPKVLPVIPLFWAKEILSRASASYPGITSPYLLSYHSASSRFVGFDQLFSCDSRTFSCDQISLGNLPTNGKK